MAAFARKVLWAVSMTQPDAEARLMEHAQACRADAVCVRTSNARLAAAIRRFHKKGIKVYGWRWPAVVPQPDSKTHHYALDEAAYVAAELIPAGLDGYVMDPESAPGSPSDDWNDMDLGPLARSFFESIRKGAEGRPDFVLGVTSGCVHPTAHKKTPWPELVAASGALLPQTYWRWTNPSTGRVEDINGGAPDKAIARGLKSWRKLSAVKPIVPMAGEIEVAKAEEITAYAALVRAGGLDQYHYYADTAAVSAAVLQAIRDI